MGEFRTSRVCRLTNSRRVPYEIKIGVTQGSSKVEENVAFQVE